MEECGKKQTQLAKTNVPFFFSPCFSVLTCRIIIICLGALLAQIITWMKTKNETWYCHSKHFTTSDSWHKMRS